MRTWEDNADEFRELDRGEGWPFAALIAGGVVKGVDAAATRASAATSATKTTSATFARRAETSTARVDAYFRAWERAADAGVVPHAADLRPEFVLTFVAPDTPWKQYYVTPKGGIQRGNIGTAVATIENRGAAEVVKSLNPEQRKAVMVEAIKQGGRESYRELQETVAEVHRDVAASNRDLKASVDAADERALPSSPLFRESAIAARLAAARRSVREALSELHRQREMEPLDSEWVDGITLELDRLQAAIELLRLGATGSADIDWDAELADLGEAR